MRWRAILRRILKYNTVSVIGVPLKFAVLTAAVELGDAGYLVATAIAVETVILHNFGWHLRWTWRDRSFGLSTAEVLTRLLKFQLGNGAIAMAVNLGVMRWLTGAAGIHYLPANIAATVLAGSLNFLLSEFFVFLAPRHAAGITTATAPSSPSSRI